MGMTELMRKYELMIIVDSKLSNDEKDGIFKSVNEAVTKSGAKIINSQVWLDKNKFSFKLKKSTEGVYYLVNYEAPSDANAKIEVSLKLNEKILRLLTSKIE